jgi:hypothetical protein
MGGWGGGEEGRVCIYAFVDSAERPLVYWTEHPPYPHAQTNKQKQKQTRAQHSVTAGIDALGEVTVRLEDVSTGKIYYGRSANTDVVVAATQAYLSALNRVAVSRGSLPVHPQFGKI